MAKRVRRTYTYTARSWMFELSFWVVVFIGAALAVAGIINTIATYTSLDMGWAKTVCNWVKQVCVALGMIVPVVMSYQVASQKSKTWFILWIVFVVLVVVGVVLSGLGM